MLSVSLNKTFPSFLPSIGEPSYRYNHGYNVFSVLLIFFFIIIQSGFCLTDGSEIGRKDLLGNSADTDITMDKICLVYA